MQGENKTEEEKSGIQLWQLIFSQLKARLPKPAFDIWIMPIKSITLKNEILKVYVKTSSHKTWLERNFHHVIHDLIEHVTDRKITIEFHCPQPDVAIEPKNRLFSYAFRY